MKFDYASTTFKLEFQRKHKDVLVMHKGRAITVKSRYPYTTARLLESRLGMAPVTTYEYTVGCLPIDKFSNEAGRIAALRGLTHQVKSEELRKAIWEAYLNRAKMETKS